MNKLSMLDGWIIAWAFTYLICAIVKPNIYIGESETIGVALMLSMFLLLMACVFSAHLGCHKLSMILCFITGFLQAFATVGSYTGIIKFQGSVGYSEASQLSMALLNFISAVCLITKGLAEGRTEKNG